MKQKYFTLKLPLIDGSYNEVKKEHIAGFCHCDTHRGYLSVTLLKNHDCIKKQCTFLEKFEEYPFWKNYERQLKEKERHKEAEKQKQLQKEAHKAEMRRLEQAAQGIADRLGFPIIVTRITPKKDAKNNYEYILNYVSEDMGSRWSDYYDLAVFLGKSHGGKYMLRPLRKPDGSLATLRDWLNRKDK